MLRGLHHSQAPAFLAGGHHVQVSVLQDPVLHLLGHVSMEANQALHAQLAGVFAQILCPPAIADNVQADVRVTVAQTRHSVHGVLQLLVWHQAGQSHEVDGVLVGVGQKRNMGNGIHSVAHNIQLASRNAQFNEFVGGRRAHRDPAGRAVYPRGDSRLDEPAQAGQEWPSHRPLLAVAMMGQHHRGRGREDRGEKRHPVLRVHHHICIAEILQRADAETRAEQCQPGARVHRQVAATAGKQHGGAIGLALHLPPLRPRVHRGTKDHFMALISQVLRHALEVRLAASTLGVIGVSPAKKYYFHDV